MNSKSEPSSSRTSSSASSGFTPMYVSYETKETPIRPQATVQQSVSQLQEAKGQVCFRVRTRRLNFSLRRSFPW